MFLAKPVDAPWVPDSAVSSCMLCNDRFRLTLRRHHCRKCGGIFCAKCSEVVRTHGERRCKHCASALYLLDHTLLAYITSYLGEAGDRTAWMQAGRKGMQTIDLPYMWVRGIEALYNPKCYVNEAGQEVHRDLSGRDAALWKIRKDTVCTWERWECVLDEVELLCRVGGCRSVVGVTGVFQTPREVVVCCEVVDGIRVSDIMERCRGGLCEEVVHNIVAGLLEVESMLKGRGMVDVGSVVMGDKEGRGVKVMRLAQVGQAIGSPCASSTSSTHSTPNSNSSTTPTTPLAKHHDRPPPIFIPGHDPATHAYSAVLRKAAQQRALNLTPPPPLPRNYPTSNRPPTSHIGAYYCHLLTASPCERHYASYTTLNYQCKQLASALLSDCVHPSFILDKIMGLGV